MSEILYRAKRKDNGEWVYGEFTLDDSLLPDEICGLIRQDSINYVIDGKTIGQYIGSKDCNGINICEGDIIKFTNTSYGKRTGRVEYILFDNSFCVVSEGIIFKFSGIYNNVEIIGNIHDYWNCWRSPQMIAEYEQKRSPCFYIGTAP